MAVDPSSPTPATLRTFAFVSGKGGVGKSILASNFAWVCSQVARTLLMDLDFQNQGLKGLFAPHARFSRANVLGALQSAGDADLQKAVEVAQGLCFLPSVSWQHATSQDEIARCANAPDFRQRLNALIQSGHNDQGFQIVVLDCHGGVDAVSLAAFQTCEDTMLVTEADSVTFNGTLELLHYYETKSAEYRPAIQADGPTNSSSSSARLVSVSRPSPNLRFIVNRLSSKYQWKDLERIYQRFMAKGMGTFSSDRSIFCYIPAEEMLADSFGEYPFHVKLAPNSIFAKKIHFMAYSLLNGRFALPSRYKPLLKFRKARYCRKIERVVVSYEHKNTQYILLSFAWISSLLALALMILGGISIHDGWHEHFAPGHESAFTELKNVAEAHFILVLVFAAVMFVTPLVWFPLRAIFGLMFLYRDKYRFQKALFRAISPQLSFWQRLSLAKLLILRVGTSVIPLMLALYVAVGALAGILLLLSNF